MTTEVEPRRHRVQVVRLQPNKVVRKKKCKRAAAGGGRRTTAVPAALQKLFSLCRHVFRGPGTVPPPDHVHNLCHILDNMGPEDVGLSRDLQFFKPDLAANGLPRVTTTTIYSCDKFSLCLFFLPATGVIPLHNHPGMTVCSKLLLGTMHIKAYDWADRDNSDDPSPSSQLRLARLKANKVFTAPCNTSVLYPTSGGNIHAFTAITPCIVLDVIGPPYSKDDDRDCTYYKDTPYSEFSNGDGNGESIAATEETKNEEEECFGWLEVIEMPEESEMDVIPYLGPQIVDTTLFSK